MSAAREELVELLVDEAKSGYVIRDVRGYPELEPNWYRLITKLLSWKDRHTPPPVGTVTREQVQALFRHHRCRDWENHCVTTTVQGVVSVTLCANAFDDLLTLCTGTRGAERGWCAHFEWVQKAGHRGWWRIVGDHDRLPTGTDQWDICPVADCHAPRPVARPMEGR